MDYARVKWACRRGMLELDLIFEPYVDKCYPHASKQEQALFDRFLESSDQDLYDWLLKKKAPHPAEFSDMIEILLSHD